MSPSEKVISTVSEVAATSGTIVLNIVTWSGTLDVFEITQKALTIALTLAMFVFYGYQIMEKRRARKKDIDNDSKAA